MRIIRAALSIMLILQSIQISQWPVGLLGGMLLFQAITNTGCCGAAGCSVPVNKKNQNIDTIEYEEVK